MRILITGANGFVGQALSHKLFTQQKAGVSSLHIDSATLLDVRFDHPSPKENVKQIVGSIGDHSFLEDALKEPYDLVFHLASIPGGLAERDYDLGRAINVTATLELLELLRRQATPPVVVFASTIGVYGAPLPDFVTDDTPARPNNMSYSAQKMIGEILVDDFSRRGWIDGRSIRLPGIVARPPEPNGAISIFMSDLIRELAAGRSYTCPISAGSTVWLMSARCVADNLLHAALLPQHAVAERRTWLLPVVRTSIGELVQDIARMFGSEVLERIRYEPMDAVENVFGRQPPIDVPASRAAGFVDDGSIEMLIRNALQGAR